LVSMWRFCCSNPRMAAAMISAVSFCVGIVSPVNQTVYRSFGCQRQCFYGVEPKDWPRS
jgi:hypothetical protein